MKKNINKIVKNVINENMPYQNLDIDYEKKYDIFLDFYLVFKNGQFNLLSKDNDNIVFNDWYDAIFPGGRDFFICRERNGYMTLRSRNDEKICSGRYVNGFFYNYNDFDRYRSDMTDERREELLVDQEKRTNSRHILERISCDYTYCIENDDNFTVQIYDRKGRSYLPNRLIPARYFEDRDYNSGHKFYPFQKKMYRFNLPLKRYDGNIQRSHELFGFSLEDGKIYELDSDGITKKREANLSEIIADDNYRNTPGNMRRQALDYYQNVISSGDPDDINHNGSFEKEFDMSDEEFRNKNGFDKISKEEWQNGKRYFIPREQNKVNLDMNTGKFSYTIGQNKNNNVENKTEEPQQNNFQQMANGLDSLNDMGSSQSRDLNTLDQMGNQPQQQPKKRGFFDRFRRNKNESIDRIVSDVLNEVRQRKMNEEGCGGATSCGGVGVDGNNTINVPMGKVQRRKIYNTNEDLIRNSKELNEVKSMMTRLNKIK